MSTKNNPLGDYGKLLKTLNKYSDETRMRFLKLVDEQNIDIKQAREFILNTQRYNSNARKKFKTEKERLEKEWQMGLSEKQKHDLYEEDTGKLTKRGGDILRRYVENKMGDLYPEKVKSILISPKQIEHQGYSQIFETRQSMAQSDYFEKRIDIYIENYEKALRKHFEDNGYFADIYSLLTREQKLKLLQNTSGKIQYVYQEEEDSFFLEFKDKLAEIDLTPEQTYDILKMSSEEGGSYYTEMFDSLFSYKYHDMGDKWTNDLMNLAGRDDFNIYSDLQDELDYYDDLDDE